MSKDYGTELNQSFTDDVAGLVVFVYLDWPSGAVRVHNSIGTYEWGGFEWLGVGGFGGIEPIEETADVVDQPIKITLSSVTPEIISAVVNDAIKNTAASIYLGAVDVEGSLLGTPYEPVTGFVEYADVVVGESSGVSLAIGSLVGRMKRRNNKRYTLEDHQQEFPGDLFLQYLPYVMEAQVTWAGERVRAGFRNEQGFPGGERVDRSDRRRRRQDERR